MSEPINLPDRLPLEEMKVLSCMSDLRMGWELVEIRDVVDQFRTIDPRKSPVDTFTYVDISSIDNQKQAITAPKEFLGKDAPSRARRVIKNGDTLFSTVRTYLKKIALVSGNLDGALTSTGICILRPRKLIDPHYLFHWVRADEFVNSMSKSMDGTLYPAVTDGDVYSGYIPLPPLNEQRRIVAKLDRLFARSRRAREELGRVSGLCDRYKQAVLAAAFRGDLTADWREKNPISEKSKDLLIRLQRQQGIIREFISDDDLNEDQSYISLPSNWCWSKVEDIGEVFLGRQRSPKNHNGPNMRPYVRAANITWNGWNTSDIKEMNFDDRDFKKYKLQPGDVLVNEGSGSADEVGKPAIWNDEVEDCCFQNTLICVRPFESMSRYLYFVFLHAARSKTFVEETRGVNIFHIGKERLSQFKVALPPIEEQKEIVQRAEKLFKAIDSIEQDYQKASQLLDRLEQATLAKAFRGKLVPQDPNDEPAAALLERIQAERQEQPKDRAVKSRRKPGKRAGSSDQEANG